MYDSARLQVSGTHAWQEHDKLQLQYNELRAELSAAGRAEAAAERLGGDLQRVSEEAAAAR